MLDNIGYIAMCLTSGASLPGIIRACKRKSTSDLSLWSLWSLEIGIICWLIYGIHIGKTPMIISNSISGSFQAIMLFLRYKYGNK